MKYILSLFLFSILYFNMACKKDCNKEYHTANLSADNTYRYFPHSLGDTVSFIRNNTDTLNFIVTEYSKNYDERIWQPTGDGTECAQYFHTQNITQHLQSATAFNIKLNAYVTEGDMYTACSPCLWSYIITVENEVFNTDLMDVKDSITFNGYTYTGVQYMTKGIDTVYKARKGIIRIVTPQNILNRIEK